MTAGKLLAPSMLCILVAGHFSVAPAVAGVFDVKGSDVEKGETEIGSNNTYFSGYPVNADRLRFTSEFGVGYGLTDWLKAGAKITMDKPVDDDFRASTAGIEAQAMLKKFSGGLGIGWFTGADFSIHKDETNTLTFGPIIQLGTDKTQVLLNPFFARTFGRNREEGMEFAYAWAVKQEVREGFGLGIEGYGVIPNLANSPSTAFQEHRIGPVIYLERKLGDAKGHGKGLSVKDVGGADRGSAEGPKFALEAGVLLGLTDGTQDVAFKLKGGITF